MTRLYWMKIRYSLRPAASVLETLLTNDEVSPLDETALARQFRFSALRRLRTTQLRPTMTGPTKTEDRRGMKLQQLTFIHRRDREFSRSPEGARTPREQVNFYKQVEQVLTDALRCSDVENMDLEQVSPRSTLARLAAGQDLFMARHQPPSEAANQISVSTYWQDCRIECPTLRHRSQRGCWAASFDAEVTE